MPMAKHKRNRPLGSSQCSQEETTERWKVLNSLWLEECYYVCRQTTSCLVQTELVAGTDVFLQGTGKAMLLRVQADYELS